MAPTRRFPWRAYLWVLLAILLVGLAPLIGVLIAGWIAEANGCVLHEGFSNPCLVGGGDLGGLLYSLFVLGWLMLATIPFGGAALLVWVVALLLHRRRWKAARTSAPSTG